MSRGRVRILGRRAGLPNDPLGHLTTIHDYEAAVRGLSDREFQQEHERVLAQVAATRTDDAVRDEWRAAQAEADAAAGLNQQQEG